jgi:hypothetical protein
MPYYFYVFCSICVTIIIILNTLICRFLNPFYLPAESSKYIKMKFFLSDDLTTVNTFINSFFSMFYCHCHDRLTSDANPNCKKLPEARTTTDLCHSC